MNIIVKLTLVSLLLVQPGMEADATASRVTNDTIPTRTRADYLRASKAQNATAIAMVSVGGATFVFGLLKAFTTDVNNVLSDLVQERRQNNTGYIIAAVVGGGLALASIPVFKSARRNKKMALMTPEVTFRMQSSKQPVFSGVRQTNFPSVAVKLAF